MAQLIPSMSDLPITCGSAFISCLPATLPSLPSLSSIPTSPKHAHTDTIEITNKQYRDKKTAEVNIKNKSKHESKHITNNDILNIKRKIDVKRDNMSDKNKKTKNKHTIENIFAHSVGIHAEVIVHPEGIRVPRDGSIENNGDGQINYEESDKMIGVSSQNGRKYQSGCGCVCVGEWAEDNRSKAQAVGGDVRREKGEGRS